MKRIIPFAFPVIIGFFSGVAVECLLCVMSVMFSPFSGPEQAPALLICGILTLVSAILAVICAIFNARYLLNNGKTTKKTFLLQTTTATIFFFTAWALSNFVVKSIL